MGTMGDDFTHQAFGKVSSSSRPRSCSNGKQPPHNSQPSETTRHDRKERYPEYGTYTCYDYATQTFYRLGPFPAPDDMSHPGAKI
ncbi:MAG: hypothetical protein QOD58_3098 [Mycobacterium sp.]|jgi:hypothetical protein|nr:hypothetical protein [Mycobacterium sp.]